MPKKLNLLGEKFGKLLVIEEAPNIDNRTAWKCQCDCGKEKIVRTKELRNGIVKSCGCLRTEQSGIQIGDKIDDLTIIEKTEKRHQGSIVWKCQCICGNIVERGTASLHRKYHHSCGCYNKKIIQSLSYKDLTGQKFGKLTVLKQAKRKEGDPIKWLCQCDCGRQIEVRTNSLTSGNTSSCGCINYSIGEKNIQEILDKNNIIYKTQWTCKELNKKRFDFAILNDNKIIRLIEFDGQQHYTDSSGIWNSTETLKDIQQRDQLKNKYAKSHNIPLVRIPYWKRDNITLDMILGDKYLI